MNIETVLYLNQDDLMYQEDTVIDGPAAFKPGVFGAYMSSTRVIYQATPESAPVVLKDRSTNQYKGLATIIQPHKKVKQVLLVDRFDLKEYSTPVSFFNIGMPLKPELENLYYETDAVIFNSDNKTYLLKNRHGNSGLVTPLT